MRAINERPILFNSEMVRAILDGRKTQTRRVMKVQPPDENYKIARLVSTTGNKRNEGKCEWILRENEHTIKHSHGQYFSNPYGLADDHLWVRETWATGGTFDHIKPSDLPATGSFFRDDLRYRADQYNDPYFKWRPSIFMPRWASRITLQIKNVRVERLQDINEADAQNEGWNWQGHDTMKRYDPVTMRAATSWFKDLWDSINSKRGYGWGSNPWVWVVEFGVLKAPDTL